MSEHGAQEENIQFTGNLNFKRGNFVFEKCSNCHVCVIYLSIIFQELVNKELWDKNKQIERLELRLAAQSAVCNRNEVDLKEAKRKLTELGVNVPSVSLVSTTYSFTNANLANFFYHNHSKAIYFLIGWL